MIEYSVKIWSMILTGYKVLDPEFSGGQYQIWSLKFMLGFLSMSYLRSYNSIFKTET